MSVWEVLPTRPAQRFWWSESGMESGVLLNVALFKCFLSTMYEYQSKGQYKPFQKLSTSFRTKYEATNLSFVKLLRWKIGVLVPKWSWDSATLLLVIENKTFGCQFELLRIKLKQCFFLPQKSLPLLDLTNYVKNTIHAAAKRHITQHVIQNTLLSCGEDPCIPCLSLKTLSYR